MILHRLGGSLDSSSCGFRSVPRPNMDPVEDCGLMPLPSCKRCIDFGKNAAQVVRSLSEDVFIRFWPRAGTGHLGRMWTRCLTLTHRYPAALAGCVYTYSCE